MRWAANADYTDVLQGGYDMEGASPSERVAVIGSDDERQPSDNGVRMDGQRKHQ